MIIAAYYSIHVFFVRYIFTDVTSIGWYQWSIDVSSESCAIRIERVYDETQKKTSTTRFPH